jgi:hypothetical protein
MSEKCVPGLLQFYGADSRHLCVAARVRPSTGWLVEPLAHVLILAGSRRQLTDGFAPFPLSVPGSPPGGAHLDSRTAYRYF